MSKEAEQTYIAKKDYVLNLTSSATDRRAIPALVLLADEIHELAATLRLREEREAGFRHDLLSILRNRLP